MLAHLQGVGADTVGAEVGEEVGRRVVGELVGKRVGGTGLRVGGVRVG